MSSPEEDARTLIRDRGLCGHVADGRVCILSLGHDDGLHERDWIVEKNSYCVSNGTKTFVADSHADAEWLASVLTRFDDSPNRTSPILPDNIVELECEDSTRIAVGISTELTVPRKLVYSKVYCSSGTLIVKRNGVPITVGDSLDAGDVISVSFAEPSRHRAYIEADFESIRRGGSCRMATCLCGWKGPQRATLEMAADDALEHEANGT